MAEQSKNFYESERKNIVVTAEDFAYIDSIEDSCDKSIVDINDYLLEKEEWENALIKKRKFNDISVQVANIIFDDVNEKYKRSVSTVYIFDVITSFYCFEPKAYYNKLSHHFRKMLLNDLKKSITNQLSIKQEDELSKQLPFEQLMNLFK